MIGDVLVSSIICNNLKKGYPDAEIHYMVYESTLPVLLGNPNIDKIILFTNRERRNKWAFLKFLLKIRKEKYDILIDSYSKLESWLTTFFSGAQRRISYKKPARSFLYTDVVRTFNEPMSNLGLIIERRLSLLDPLNLDIDPDPVPKLYITQAEKLFANQLLADHGVDSSPKKIMISILGSSPVKSYPLVYMAKLIDFIVEQTNALIFFNYIPSQLKDAKALFEHCAKETQQNIYFDLLGKNLREYIALMNACDLIIGNDGGAINIAKALGKPSFIIFSPWIEKRMWATFEEGRFHRSVHLKDFEPALFKGKTEKELKKSSLALYQYFNPEFIYPYLKSFLDFNLKNRQELNINAFVKLGFEKERKPFSAIVITRNEAENLPSLIRNLRFADELLIVDSFSTDETAKIIEQFPGVKCMQRKFENYSDQRNFALAQASNDWILFIDADERVPKALQAEIYEVLSEPFEIQAFELYRQFYFDDQPLHYGGFQTDKAVRFFNRNYVSYDNEKLVHETPQVRGKIGVLKTKLLHFSYKNYDSYKQKMEAYAFLRARELMHKQVQPGFFHFLVKPAYRFFYHYIIRRGFLDGKAGYTMAKLNSYGVKQRYVKLKKLRANR